MPSDDATSVDRTIRRRGAPKGAYPAFEPAPRRRKTPYAPPRWSDRVYVRLAQEHIALFKFLLEAHGHLGIMSVLDRHAAVLVVRFSPDCRRELEAFLKEAAETVPLLVEGFSPLETGVTP